MKCSSQTSASLRNEHWNLTFGDAQLFQRAVRFHRMLICERVPAAVNIGASISIFHRAREKQKEGKFREAERLYLKVIRLLPSGPPQPIHVQVHHRLGEMY